MRLASRCCDRIDSASTCHLPSLETLYNDRVYGTHNAFVINSPRTHHCLLELRSVHFRRRRRTAHGRCAVTRRCLLLLLLLQSLRVLQHQPNVRAFLSTPTDARTKMLSEHHISMLLDQTFFCPFRIEIRCDSRHRIVFSYERHPSALVTHIHQPSSHRYRSRLSHHLIKRMRCAPTPPEIPDRPRRSHPPPSRQVVASLLQPAKSLDVAHVTAYTIFTTASPYIRNMEALHKHQLSVRVPWHVRT